MNNTLPENLANTRRAAYLCLSPVVGRSMTPMQIAVFKQLCFLQMDDAGPHSLLPNVMDAFLELARRPWWDRGVAGIADEPSPWEHA